MYHPFVPQMTKVLSNMNNFFDKAIQHAEQKKYDPNLLLQSRLAPDQYPLAKQVQVACDFVKGTTARLAGKEIPKHPDTETTIPQLRERIQKVVDYLATFKAEDFHGWEDRRIDIFYMPGKTLSGFEYLHEFAVPNIYFHVGAVYSILRNQGVDVGKSDYIGKLDFKSKE